MVMSGRKSSVGWLWPAVIATCMCAAPAVLAQPQMQERDGFARGTADGRANTEEVDRCRPPSGLSPVEAENRAFDHYDRGRILYEQGDYEAAVFEFAAAYCSKASYVVLKDIAQAFERLVNYEKAVAYLQRYVREAPASEFRKRSLQMARIAVLRKLPARLRIATMPPRASVTLRRGGSVVARGVADDEPLLIRKGRYTMTIEHEGHLPLMQDIEVEIGQPYSFNVRLEPKKQTLRIVTVPAHGRIFIDKRLVAVGGYVREMPLGRYQVEVEAEGHHPSVRSVEITETQGADLTVVLARLPSSGRRQLLMAAGVGSGLASGALTAVLGGDGPVPAVGGIIGFLLGIGGVYLATPEGIPEGHSSYIIGTSIVVTAETLLLAGLLGCGANLQDCSDSLTGGLVTGSIVGGAVIGAATAARLDLSAGDAAVINSGAIWGVITGALASAAFESDQQVVALLLFGGLNLGVLTGGLLAQRTELSRRHVSLIDLSGLAGLVVGYAAGSVITTGDDSAGQTVPNASLGGMVLGLIVGSYLTQGMDVPKLGPSLLSRRMDAVDVIVRPNITSMRDMAGQSSFAVGVRGEF